MDNEQDPHISKEVIARIQYERIMNGQQSIFEVCYLDKETRKVSQSYKVYADGKIEGFPKGACIFNFAKSFIDLVTGMMEEKGIEFP